MQIAADVRRPNLKKAAQRKLELKHLRIPFVRQDAVVTKAQAQMRADKSKEMWLKIFPNIVKKEVPAPGV